MFGAASALRLAPALPLSLLPLLLAASAGCARAALPTTYGDLALRYASFDDGDCDGWAALFAPGATDHEPDGEHSGDGLKSYCAASLKEYEYQAVVVDRYVANNFSFVQVAFSYVVRAVNRSDSGRAFQLTGAALIAAGGSRAKGLQVAAARNFYAPPGGTTRTPALDALVTNYVSDSHGNCSGLDTEYDAGGVAYEPANANGIPTTTSGLASLVSSCLQFYSALQVEQNLSFFVDYVALYSPRLVLVRWWSVMSTAAGYLDFPAFSLLKLDANSTISSTHDYWCAYGTQCFE